MSEQTSIKWHEIINSERDTTSLQFLDLYREYAEALKEREATKRRDGFWPYPR